MMIILTSKGGGTGPAGGVSLPIFTADMIWVLYVVVCGLSVVAVVALLLAMAFSKDPFE